LKPAQKFILCAGFDFKKMTMKISVALFLTFLSISLFAQQPITPNNEEQKSAIIFENISHDFGNIKEGTMVTYEFVFTNTGKTPLVINTVQPSCGCTTPEWSREPIAPGAKGKIKAIYNTYGRPGNFQKYVTVKSNAVTGSVDLTIKGVVITTPVEPISPVRNQLNNE
jgi:Protein of unknown function (DUF1573)